MKNFGADLDLVQTCRNTLASHSIYWVQSKLNVFDLSWLTKRCLSCSSHPSYVYTLELGEKECCNLLLYSVTLTISTVYSFEDR